MRVLFVDEEEASVEDGMARLGELEHECKRIDFGDLEATIPSFNPDIIVLDMMNGSDPKGEGGKTSFDKIWDTRFCPIVVYSAAPDLIDDIDSEKAKNPLVQKVQKGSGSDERLRDEVNKLLPCIEGINAIIADVNSVLQVTLKEVATHIASQDGIDEIATVIQHMGRRRLAAQIDDSSFLRSELHPSEQYIYPPIDSCPKMGDIIRDSGSDSSSPASFYVVLTPSCDLVNNGGQTPNVDDVLCASCENPDLMLKKVYGSKLRDVRKNLPSLLMQGHIDECLPLPELQGIIPPMVANLKKLKLVPYGSIKNDGKDFIRVASVDSPFREQIAWAYLNIGSRPGVPARDKNIWAKQYFDALADKGEEK